VKSGKKLWETWHLAKIYKTRPSELLGVHDELAAFYLDRAVATFGSLVENEMHSAGEGKKEKQAEMARNLVLVKWIPELLKGKFREPMATKGR
jgi:hypothetical protein